MKPSSDRQAVRVRWTPTVAVLVPMIAWLGLLGCRPESGQPSVVAQETVSEATGSPTVPWTRLPPPSDLPTDRPLDVGFLIVDGVYNSELMAPWDLFHHTVFHTQPGMQVFAISPDGRPVTSFEGLTISAHFSFESAPAIDVLVVPSAEGSMDKYLDDDVMIDWVRTVGEQARYVVSLCDGAFVLAQAGLLDDVQATTFPGDLDAFAERFPDIDLIRDVSVVFDHTPLEGPSAVTSAGGAKSYDPAMVLIDHLYGEAVAQGVGRGMVIDWPTEAAAIKVHVAEPRPRSAEP